MSTCGSSASLPLLYGQAIALVVASMNAASYTLSYHSNVNMQLFQLFLMYLLLSVHLLFRESKAVSNEGPREISRTKRILRLQLPWWKYMFLSLLDVIPNFMQLASFQYTSLTSTTLLGSMTVPTTMLASHFVLGRLFGRHHFVGVVLCLVGGAMAVWSDVDSASRSHHSWLGDALAVLAAVVNGSTDVLSEYCVKNKDRYELLGMLGLFGAIFTGVSFPYLERQALFDIVYNRSVKEQSEIAGIILWYVASVLAYYMMEAFFLVTSEATLLNLSLQTSNLWAILFAFVVFRVLPPMLFYPALILVVGGVFVYEAKNTKTTVEPRGTTLDPEKFGLQPTKKIADYSATSIDSELDVA